MGNAQGPIQEGHIVSVPKTDNCPQERPYNGPPVIYYVIAGRNRETLDPMIDEQYRKGRRLLLFRKKPLSWFHVGIFREPADVVDTLQPPPYSECHQYSGPAIGTGSYNAMGQLPGPTNDMSMDTEHPRTPEKSHKPLNRSDRFSHQLNASDTRADTFKFKDRFHEPSEISDPPSDSVDRNMEPVTFKNGFHEPSRNLVLPDTFGGVWDSARDMTHEPSAGPSEKHTKPLNPADRCSHPTHDTNSESFKFKGRFHEPSESPHHLPGAVGGPLVSTSNSKQHWRRGVVNLWLHGQHRRLPKATDGTKRDLWVADPLCLADALTYNFQNGERVICMYMTTEQRLYQQKDIPSGVKTTPGITKTIWCQHQDQLQFDQSKACYAILLELLFEAPLHPPQERYIYTVVAAPATIVHKRPDTGTMGHSLGLAVVNCSWEGTFHDYLQQGWRLVDVMVDFRPPMESVDSLAMTQFQYRYGSGDDERTVATWHPIDTQTLWIFEKPASRQHDPTPIFEGKIVPFAFKYGQNPPICWDDEIRSMGSRGWELACFVERVNYWPIKESGSSDTETMVQSLLFFQRPFNL